MTQPTNWEKSESAAKLGKSKSRLKFLIGGLMILAAGAYLIVYGTTSSARYFITVDELVNDTALHGETVRITGAVIGESIVYDSENLILDFTIAHIPAEVDDLAKTLYLAVNDPNAAQLPVHIENEVKPDLLTGEAQAILTGEMGEDGVFYASELLLKCPSRYEEAVPEQSIAME